jgi:hypothetical protein
MIVDDDDNYALVLDHRGESRSWTLDILGNRLVITGLNAPRISVIRPW